MTEIKDNREVMRNRIPNEVCRVCGSRDVHVDHYGQPTVKCITYLRTWGNKAIADLADLKAKCDAMAELCEAAKEVIEMQRAYDTKFFPEVPKEKWADVTIAVANVGVSLDCISASNMRHTAKRAADILGEPLAQAFAAMESEQPTGD